MSLQALYLVGYLNIKKKHNIQTEQPDFQELKTRAIKMLKANKTQKQIAKELGISNYTLSNWLRPYKEKHNIRTKRQTHPQEVKDKAIEMFKSGISTVKIAEELEVATRTISNWLRPYKEKHNIRTKRQTHPQEVKDKAIEMF